MIIEIEGIDGVGKTTQCELLRTHLEKTGRSVTVVKDLESTELGRGIRQILVSGEPRTIEVELFSFLACKSQLYSQVIIPTLKKGGVVICDRGIGSFVSYFESHGFSRNFLLSAIELGINGLRPELTLLLDVSTEVATERKSRKTEQSKFDMMGEEFFIKQKKIFLELSESPSWVVIDGGLLANNIHQLISRHVESVLF